MARGVSYVETCKLLVQLGYMPGLMVFGTLGPTGYETAEGAVRRWAKPDHWERIEAAMMVDADASRSPKKPDAVNHPSHYTSDPSGVECITITRHRNFNVGNAIKYLWRAGLKESAAASPLAKQIEDLEKARWYIGDEIERLRAQKESA